MRTAVSVLSRIADTVINDTAATQIIFHSLALTSPPHILTLYRAFVAACAAYDSLNLSGLHYITDALSARQCIPEM